MVTSWFEPFVVASAGEVVVTRERVDRYTLCFHFWRAG